MSQSIHLTRMKNNSIIILSVSRRFYLLLIDSSKWRLFGFLCRYRIHFCRMKISKTKTTRIVCLQSSHIYCLIKCSAFVWEDFWLNERVLTIYTIHGTMTCVISNSIDRRHENHCPETMQCGFKDLSMLFWFCHRNNSLIMFKTRGNTPTVYTNEQPKWLV